MQRDRSRWLLARISIKEGHNWVRSSTSSLPFSPLDILTAASILSQGVKLRTDVWLKSLTFTNQPASNALPLVFPFLVFPLYTCMYSLGQRSFSYAALSVWNSIPYKVRSPNTRVSFTFQTAPKLHLFKLSVCAFMQLHACVCPACVCACMCAWAYMCVRVCMCVCVCPHAHVFVLIVFQFFCFVMGYVLQFGEIAHQTVHFCY